MTPEFTTREAVALRALIAGRTYTRAASLSGLEMWEIRSVALRAGHPSVDRMAAALRASGHPITLPRSEVSTPKASPAVLIAGRDPAEVLADGRAAGTARTKRLADRATAALEALLVETDRVSALREEKERHRILLERSRHRVKTARAELRAARKTGDPAAIARAELSLAAREDALAALRRHA